MRLFPGKLETHSTSEGRSIGLPEMFWGGRRVFARLLTREEQVGRPKKGRRLLQGRVIRT